MKNLSLLLSSFILFNISVVQSQTINKYSISKGIGLNILSYSDDFEINAFSKSYLYTIGYYFADEGFELLGNTPREKYNQFNVLFGQYIDSANKKFRFQYQGGVGIFWGTFRTDVLDTDKSSWLSKTYISEETRTIGFPLKIGGRYIPFKFLAIGIDLQVNLNFKKSVTVLMLNFEIGKLRN